MNAHDFLFAETIFSISAIANLSDLPIRKLAGKSPDFRRLQRVDRLMRSILQTSPGFKNRSWLMSISDLLEKNLLPNKDYWRDEQNSANSSYPFRGRFYLLKISTVAFTLVFPCIGARKVFDRYLKSVKGLMVAGRFFCMRFLKMVGLCLHQLQEWFN